MAELTTAGQDQKQPKQTKWVVVESPAIIDGSQLRNASAGQGRAGGADEYEIDFSLKKAGADKFGAWTGANLNEYMGVVLNDEVKSIAYIKGQIFDQGQISGRFTKQSADDLALTLRSGALPAPIEYLEERTVGPSLGQDSINAGVRASAVGLALVVLFMLLYYRGSGINAVVALLLNMILMMAGLILFGATLTLPGIAGACACGDGCWPGRGGCCGGCWAKQGSANAVRVRRITRTYLYVMGNSLRRSVAQRVRLRGVAEVC